jgi:hypothetical protein
MNHTLHAHSAQPFERFDIYHRIHKALRACMADALLWIRLDCADPRDVAAAMAHVRGIAAFCASHLEHEDDFVHPALEARRAGAAQQTEREHVHHAGACARLAELADAVEAAHAPVASQALARQLYRALALFFAESVVHMDMEETDNNATLWATHSGEELLAIEHAIVASLSDQQRGVTMRWMIPALTPSERLALLDGVRRQAPAAAFSAMLAGIRPLLVANDWRKLCEGLERAEPLAA